MEDLSVFDAWEPFEKARKAKGLEKWSRLAHMAEKLKGKKSSDISFTTAYPGQEGKKKILGSIEGNLHFLLGYGNPSFHFAAYHWQIIDPNLSDEEAEELYHLKGHPSRPELWARAELEDKPEGDQEHGEPHPSVAAVVEEKKKVAARAAETIKVKLGAGEYEAVPSEGLIYGVHNGHVYTWDMIKESFLASAHTELADAMNAAAEARTELEQQLDKSLNVPDAVIHVAKAIPEAFEPSVYPLIYTRFPRPGTVIPLDTVTSETVYGVITNKSVEFYSRDGAPAQVQVYDRLYKSFDLLKNGNVHPSILYGFAVSYLNLNREELEQFVSSTATEASPSVVKGLPSPGFEHLSEEDLLNATVYKSVEMDGNTFRLVLKDAE